METKMRRNRRSIDRIMCAVLTFLLSLASSSVQVLAESASSELATCVSRNLTTQDRAKLLHWIFAVVSVHPNIEGMTRISSEDREALAQGVGSLITRKLQVDCRALYQEAVREEGSKGLGAAFNVVGQEAAADLMTHPSVRAEMAKMARYFDFSTE